MLLRLLQSFQYRQALRQVRTTGLWFVDIPRTSSSSIKVELQQKFGNVYGKSDLDNPNYSIKSQVLPNHMVARDMRKRLGDKHWDQLFTFSIVRNPWDRLLSSYHYRKSNGELKQVSDFGSYLKLFFDTDASHQDSPYHYYGHYYQCADYLLDEQGTLMVDFVVRYETRAEDLARLSHVCPRLSLGKLHLNRSNVKGSYRQMYNDQTKEMVATIAKKDIELFGYGF